MGSVSLSKGRGRERDRVDGLSLAQLYTSRQTDKANPENGREGGGGTQGLKTGEFGLDIQSEIAGNAQSNTQEETERTGSQART